MSVLGCPGVLHMRIRNGKKRYRFWSGVVDAYITEECSKVQALNFMRAEALKEVERQAKVAFEQADENGAAGWGDTADIKGPWAQEICRKHGVFHHKYQDGFNVDRCGECGESAADESHHPTAGCR